MIFLNCCLGFDIAMLFRGEKVHGFNFTRPIARKVPAKDFLIGFRGSNFIARAVVNGIASVPKKPKLKNGQFISGIMFNPNTCELEL